MKVEQVGIKTVIDSNKNYPKEYLNKIRNWDEKRKEEEKLKDKILKERVDALSTRDRVIFSSVMERKEFEWANAEPEEKRVLKMIFVDLPSVREVFPPKYQKPNRPKDIIEEENERKKKSVERRALEKKSRVVNSFRQWHSNRRCDKS